MQTDQSSILADILLAPSNEVKQDRFSAANQADAAACGPGQCMPGQCKAVYA